MLNFTVYILQCKNGALYTGITKDFERRMHEHAKGTRSCKYTRAHPPVQIMNHWHCKATYGEILKLEHAIKKLPRPQKLEIISSLSDFKKVASSFSIKNINVGKTEFTF